MGKIIRWIKSFFWILPDYLDKWRFVPRALIILYGFLLWEIVEWFIRIPDITMGQAAVISVVVGAAPAFFGLYVNSGSKDKNAKIPEVENKVPLPKSNSMSKTHKASKVEVRTTYVPKVKKSGNKSKSPAIKGIQG